MNDFFIFIILAGTFLLGVSLKPTFLIYKKTNSSQWGLLLLLIIFFIMAYWWVIYYFFTQGVDTFVASSVSLILFGGSGFVVLVTRLSLSSIIKIERVSAQQRFLAEHDVLTRLPNRNKFFRILKKQISLNNSFTLFFIDLNGFKQVNDRFGHQYGDELLSLLSQSLRQHLSGIAKVYRIGGDEFALILFSRTEKKYVNCVTAINTAISLPFSIREQKITVMLSIGVSRFPDNSQHQHELLIQADLAMYEAKRTAQQVVAYFPELGHRARELSEMSTRIEKALQDNEFELHLQPILSAFGGQLHGAEVLIRWPQKNGEFIPPNKLISVAEQTGLILPLSQWVVLNSFKQLKKLKAHGFYGFLHINLSPKDLESEEFYYFIEMLVELDPSVSKSIIFEITENAMMTNLNAARKMMSKLSKMGFKFSVDDFGTGFSSLVLLRELPIDQIKIDQSFIKNMLNEPAAYAIVESTIFLASRLNCNVVAEGIEEKKVEQALIKLNCDYVQGFFYSKALSIDCFRKRYLR
ncbi:bifunctional diguanylate cyclase/phosphodiesterase [Pseudoalteromonas sp. NEC-BIFX-2020_002]|uniref:EAL domain-containing protein n=1 Tax=Pseudoalteromonas sp. NEC-BIFX-2020_002 TaxID=2732353 RepID=UPI0014777D4D|nr:bifunctional diguanylate cyclase/phosphodiesterase [Pseudoalteromonas sp. NEC-BIFX-2020_002]